ncbi:hypothetical protein SAMN04515647_1282 [Cohaesibacter sp. ES.047]|nr:hypothetical protein SAMN04515647_1282 [Cohaesibacter sp. ES.047]
MIEPSRHRLENYSTILRDIFFCNRTTNGARDEFHIATTAQNLHQITPQNLRLFQRNPPKDSIPGTTKGTGRMRDTLHIWSKESRQRQLCRIGYLAAKFKNPILIASLGQQSTPVWMGGGSLKRPGDDEPPSRSSALLYYRTNLQHAFPIDLAQSPRASSLGGFPTRAEISSRRKIAPRPVSKILHLSCLSRSD